VRTRETFVTLSNGKRIHIPVGLEVTEYEPPAEMIGQRDAPPPGLLLAEIPPGHPHREELEHEAPIYLRTDQVQHSPEKAASLVSRFKKDQFLAFWMFAGGMAVAFERISLNQVIGIALATFGIIRMAKAWVSIHEHADHPK